MKFGEAFTEYLEAHQERVLEDCCHVEYKRLKNVLKSCSRCSDALSPPCQCESCPVCDQKFFSELAKEASEIAGCFSSRVRHLLSLHEHKIQRFITFVRQCFQSPQQATEEECQMLIEYVIMNALAIRKILKKYDKVHSSANGRKFKSKMLSEHIEILQSPWLIELGAFYMYSKSNGGRSDEPNPFSCDLTSTEPKMTLMLPDMVTLEYNLLCPICLELVFKPYALVCGHLFCKSCACSAASVMIFEGPKAASSESKCPVCREVGVYGNAVHMIELSLLLKKQCKEYWKERAAEERAEISRQTKMYWDMQSKYMIGY
ncbi:probable E3 ubiquitin-protein ligase BAH1-like isoform X1 [Henckelia pumila]|uniref:probable E3 ubiquitin-protein ligase BAH1-like isoform X1 n=1 Tax=Henckelia pumila TaxID=405737 RepID=UPI003C6DFEBA